MNGSALRLAITFLPFFLSLQILNAQVYGHCDCVTLGNCPTPINDNGSFTSIIPVNLPGSNDLSECPLEKVCFTITHTWIGDLSVSLTSPAGTSYLLMADLINNYGGCGAEEDNVEVCVVLGNDNPLTNNAEYECNPGPCSSGNGICCLTGDWTVPCGGVEDPITNVLQAPNCDLNDFNVPGHPVNGVWKLTVNDVCNMDVGTLDNFSLSFACDTVMAINGCLANGGFFNLPETNACQGNSVLALDDIQPKSCFSFPPDSLYDYVLLVVRNDTVLSVNGSTDFTGYPTGQYRVYGFSFEKPAAAEVAALTGASFPATQATFLNGNAPFCGDFSSDFLTVNIYQNLDDIDCQMVVVDAGEDVVGRCIGVVNLEGYSSIGASSPCAEFLWQDMNGEVLNVDGGSLVQVSDPGLYVFSFVGSAINCIVSDTVEVFPPILPSAEFSADTLTGCVGSGLWLETEVDGSGSYQYRWRRPGIPGFMLGESTYFANSPGSYIVRVLDNGNGCSVNDTIEVLQKPKFVGGIQFTQATCDEADGAANVLVDTTVTNISYLWNTGDETPAIENVPSGWYSVTVSDDDCQFEESIFVEEELSCKVVIKGHVYNDHINPDCSEDNTTVGVPCIMLHLMPDDVYTYSKPDGTYEFIAYPGDHTVEYIDEDRYELLCPGSESFQLSLSDGGVISEANDFFVRVENGQNLKIDLSSGRARPGRNQSYSLKYINLGTEPADAVITFNYDPLLEDVSLSTSANSFDPVNHKAIWTRSNVPPGVYYWIHFTMNVPPFVTVGTELTGSVKIEPLDIDTYPEDNSLAWSKTVVGSYDPNEKSSHTGENQWGGAITENDTIISYQILFQNTGNDTAFTVVVRDTLDENLDVESIRPGIASHDYILEFEGRNVLVFNFENIMLPDSNVNEPASHGYITFTIKRDKNLMPEVEIKNDVAIYFDYNDPIITNETVHYLPVPPSAAYEFVYLCEGEEYNGENYFENTILIDTVHYEDVDSFFITEITVYPNSENSVNEIICEGSVFEMAGQVFDQPGQYNIPLTSANSCDSTILLSLELGETTETDLYISICKGGEYIFNNEALIDPGSYTANLINSFGCDSIINLTLDIDEAVTVEEDTAVVAGSEVYGVVILSDTTIVQMLMDENGCDYTLVTDVNVLVKTTELNKNIHLKVLPNPNIGQFVLKGEIPVGGQYEIAIYNIFGQLVGEQFSKIYLNKNFEWEVKGDRLAQGVYYLLLLGKENKAMVKFAVIK